MSSLPKATQLPPKIPPEAEGINRAVCLLGNRIASDLKEKAKSELISLIGAYPTEEQAKYWKHALKQLLKEEPTAPLQPKSPPQSQSFGKKPKRSLKEKVQQQREKQDVRKKAIDNDPYDPYMAGVSNLASIDLDLLRNDESEWVR